MKINIQTLPDAENLFRIEKMFREAGHEIRIVGGAVRDILRNEKPKDIDLATTATPDEMRVIGKKASVTVVATGEVHGTMTFVINHEPYEITTLRIDEVSNGRHAEVVFTRSFEEDAARRDLTFNSMSMDFDGVIHDYFGGREDLEANVVRFVGDAEKRIQEDYLRILRFFRFAARFDAQMDPVTLQTIERMAVGLDQISRERVWMEMSKLFSPNSHGRIPVFRTMLALGVGQQIGLPWIQAGELLFAESSEAAVALFFKGDGTGAREFCNSWKMSGDETVKICWIADNFHRTNMDQIEDWINEGKDRQWVFEVSRLAFWSANVNEFSAHANSFPVTPFPVKGQDLLDSGMKPGKAVGERLSAMRAKWVESRFTLSKEELLGE